MNRAENEDREVGKEARGEEAKPMKTKLKRDLTRSKVGITRMKVWNYINQSLFIAYSRLGQSLLNLWLANYKVLKNDLSSCESSQNWLYTRV